MKVIIEEEKGDVEFSGFENLVFRAIKQLVEGKYTFILKLGLPENPQAKQESE